MRLIFASNNLHKLSEVRDILGPKYNKFLYSLNDFNLKVDPDENGNTYEKNANIKSKALYEALQNKKLLLKNDFIFADDTGISIDFFDGKPGIHSARFMGDVSQSEKNKKIIELMKDVPIDKRNAHFTTKLSVRPIIIDKDFLDMPQAIIFDGRVDGYIADNIFGDEGFGYDPIFVVKEYNQTYASLGQKIKNSISHRAKAILAFVNYLEKNHNI